MDRLTREELLDLQEKIMARLPENITSLLVTLNTNGRLEEFLYMIDMGDLTEKPEPLKTWSDGKVLVIGDAQTRPKDLYGVAKKLGTSQDRIEFVDFDEAKRYNYRQLEYNCRYVAVMFGSNPHSTTGKGKETSVITRMEKNEDKYPRVIRLSAGGGLKVTKTNFRENLQSLIDSRLLVA